MTYTAVDNSLPFIGSWELIGVGAVPTWSLTAPCKTLEAVGPSDHRNGGRTRQGKRGSHAPREIWERENETRRNWVLYVI
jgi:hypothetical protein